MSSLKRAGYLFASRLIFLLKKGLYTFRKLIYLLGSCLDILYVDWVSLKELLMGSKKGGFAILYGS